MKQITIDITAETPELTFANVGIPGPRGIEGEKGEKGDAFVYTDFTPEQLAALKGDKGDKGDTVVGPQGLKGDTGNTGDKGEKGDTFTYADMTLNDKEDIRAPLRQDFAKTLLDSQAAAAASQASSVTAQTAQGESEKSRVAAATILSETKAVKTDVENSRQGITDEVTRASQLADSVASDVATIATQANDVASDASTVFANTATVTEARDTVLDAKTIIVAAEQAALSAQQDATTAQAYAESSRDEALDSANKAEGIQQDVTAKSSDVAAKHTEVLAKALQVETDKNTVVTDKGIVLTAKTDTLAAKAATETARDEAKKSAAQAAQALVYEGTWDASTGAYPVHKARNGIWKVVKAGTVGGVAFKAGQELIWNHTGSKWDIIPADTLITSVNGHAVGDIILTAADVGALPANTPLFSGKYGDLSGIPAEFTPAFHSQDWGTITGKPAQTTRWPTYAEVTGKPSLFSGKYSDLTGRPATFVPSAHKHPWTDITGKPALFSGKYSDLTGRPATFVPSAHRHPWAEIDGKPVQSTRWPIWSEVTGKPSFFSGNYKDLLGIPTTFTPKTHKHSWSDVTGEPVYTTRWPTWAEVTSKPDVVTTGSNANLGPVLNVQAPDNGDAILELNEAKAAHGVRLYYKGKDANSFALQGKQSGKYVDVMTFSRAGGVVNFPGGLTDRGQRPYSSLNKPSPSTLGVYSKTESDGRYKGKNDAPKAHTHTLAQISDRATHVPETASVLGGTDLDTLKSHLNTGFYYQDTNNNATSARHYPVTYAGSLLVQKGAGGVTQTYIHYNDGRMWTRSYYNGTWSSWVFHYDTAHKPSAADVGALPATGKAKDAEKLNGVAGTSSITKNTYALRDGSADISARLFKSNYQTQTTGGAKSGAGICFRNDNGKDNFMRFLDKVGMVDWLGRVNDSTRFLGKTLDQVKAETRSGLVPDTITINGHRLNADVKVTKGDVGLAQVADYGHTNSYAGTSTALYATQKAAYDAAAAPRLDDNRKRSITAGTAAPKGGADGDIYLQYK